jgi:hypothetical protein
MKPTDTNVTARITVLTVRTSVDGIVGLSTTAAAYSPVAANPASAPISGPVAIAVVAIER